MKLFLFIIYLFTQPLFAHQIQIDLSKITVRVVTTTWCPFCDALREKLIQEGIFPENQDQQAIIEGELPYSANESIKIQQIMVDLEDFDPYEIFPIFEPDPDVTYVPHIFIYYNDEVIHAGEIMSREGNLLGYKRVLKDKVETAINKHKNHLLSVLEHTPQLQPNSNILLVSTGTDERSIPLFNSQVIDELQYLFFRMGYPVERLLTLFGNGIDSIGVESSYPIYGGRRYHIRRLVRGFNIDIDKSSSLSSLVSTVEDLSGQNILSIFVGHGYKEGLPLWQSSDLTPEEFKSIIPDKSNHIMISGSCYSGIFAQTASCGFFAARPNRTSSGCYEQSQFDRDDYVTKMIEALETDCQGEEFCQSPFKGDLDGNRKISFAEAHWYAFLNGNRFDLPYTDLDAVTDQVLEQYLTDIPTHLTHQEFKNLIPFASKVDQIVIKNIEIPQEDPISLSIQEEVDASSDAHPITSSISQERISQMARRLFARKLIADKGLTQTSLTWNEIEKCESQDIHQFLSLQ